MSSNQQLSNGKKRINLNSVISWGAAVVIVGLMFKINHWPGGQMIIAIGLGVEALLFVLLGFMAPKTMSRQYGNQSANEDPVSSKDKTAIAGFNSIELQNYDAYLNTQNDRIDELKAALKVREGELNIARKLKESGVSYDVISKSTGLSTEDIVKL